MINSKLTGLLLAACTLAASQMSFAAGDLNILHAYNCRLVPNSSPFTEVHGAFQAGHLVNNTGSSAWAVCPLNYETTNSSFAIYLSTSASCSWLTTSAQTGVSTYYAPSASGPTTGGYYYSWSQNLGNFASAIQCLIPNGASVYAYYSA